MKLENFFATCPKNLESLLEEELNSLGVSMMRQTIAGVKFQSDMATAYRVCLWSRIANRVLFPISEFPVTDAHSLYLGIKKIPWFQHMSPENTLLVDFNGKAPGIINTHFGAQKVKDAIVDRIRDKTGTRPSVAKITPDLRVNVHLHHGQAVVSIDLSGESLHQRSYRQYAGIAPIKENLAAAILMRANWLEFAKHKLPLIDPFCGSATILIEAALMAGDIAPGLFRSHFGFQTWLQFNESIWDELWQEAQERREIGMKKLPTMMGFDMDEDLLDDAQNNINEAGLSGHIQLQVANLHQLKNPLPGQKGLLITNPPYGERMGTMEDLVPLYQHFGRLLREEFLEWQAALILGNSDLGKNMGIRAHKQYAFFNGAIPCKLLLFDINERWFVRER